MVRVDFIIKGARDNFKGGLEEIAYGKLRRQIQQKLAFVDCPEHDHRVPRVEAIGESITTLKYTVLACCQKMGDEAQKALNPSLAWRVPV